jgi:FkbM family methyltransferase
MLVNAVDVLWQFPNQAITLIQSAMLSFIKKSVYRLALSTARVVSNLAIFQTKLARRMEFDLAARGSLMIAAGPHETFVVAGSDKSISKHIFVNQEPYDFDKVHKVVAILGKERPRRLLIDVGANIGSVCIPAVRRGVFDCAIAIEPEPRNYSLLVANISLNGVIRKIATYNVALGQKDDEQVAFELAEDNFGDHRVRAGDLAGPEQSRDVITVRSETFDKIVGHLPPRDTLICMDTQGFEGHVLAGATKSLRSQPPICLEFWPYGMRRSRSFPILKSTLIRAGYDIFYNLRDSPSGIALTEQALDQLYKQLGDGAYTEYTDLLVLRSPK